MTAFYRKMTNQERSKQLRTFLIERILTAIHGNTLKENIIDLAKSFHNKPEIQCDIALLQSVALLEFLAKQMIVGNSDVITPELVQESYAHILEKLAANTKYI